MTDYRSSHLDKGKDYDARLASEPFAAYSSARDREILLRLVGRLFPSGIPRFLDFACGTGRITSVVEPFAERSYAVDVSAAMIERARARCPRTEFHLLDLTARNSPFEPFDLITSFRFLGNAEDELRRSSLHKLHELLRPGGFLIVNNHRNPWAVHRLLGSGHGSGRLDLTPPKLRHLLEETGFRIVERHGVGVWYVRRRLDSILRGRRSLVRQLEKLSELALLRPVCPEVIVVAQPK